LALLGLSPAIFAQDPLERELEFVRALAERMRFIELAKEETERLAQEHRAAADQDRIAQLSVQISFYGAKARGDREVQRTLYKEAIEKSKELIERSSDAKVLLQARATLAEASREFGQFMIEELEVARETNPDAVKALEEEASEVFRAGIEACKKVKDELQSQRDPQKQIEFGLFWMRMGVLMREQGRAVKADRAVLVERAIGELTEMVLHFGEETAIGLKGLFEIAQCYEVLEDMAQAMDMYRSTMEQITTSLDDVELALSGDTQALLF
jgi:tetratricopeptide (TPR) repeat protein